MVCDTVKGAALAEDSLLDSLGEEAVCVSFCKGVCSMGAILASAMLAEAFLKDPAAPGLISRDCNVGVREGGVIIERCSLLALCPKSGELILPKS